MATCLLNTSKWIGYRRSWPMSALAGSFSHASVFSRQTESSRTPASLTEFVRDPDCDPDRRYLPVAVRLARHRRLGDDCPNRLAPAALRAPWLDVGAQWGTIPRAQSCPHGVSMPLTDKSILEAKPESKAKKLFDGGGLYIEVAPSGGRLWRLKYRFGGREKRLALGTY